MGRVRRIFVAAAFPVFAALLFFAAPTVRCRASEPVVVVIDPGHGGENRGGEVEGQFLEKEITLQAALAMKQTLEQFEGVEVYLTRTADQELSLEELQAVSPLFEQDVYNALNLENCMALRSSYGGPAVSETARQIGEIEQFIQERS